MSEDPRSATHQTRIDVVRSEDVSDLLPMLRAYCDFYEVNPPDGSLAALVHRLIDHPEQGTQLIARSDSGEPLGFATVYWSRETLNPGRIGVMNDLFVRPEHRGEGVADELIHACRRLAAEHGANRLTWQTAPDNARAQRVYERVGASREQWVDYWIAVS